MKGDSDRQTLLYHSLHSRHHLKRLKSLLEIKDDNSGLETSEIIVLDSLTD